jgi:transposase
LDLGDKYSVFHVLDVDGQTLEEGRVKTSESGLARLTRTYGSARIVLEVGPHSAWVSRAFLDWGHREVLVANPAEIPTITNSRRKSDRTDAEHLARLGRTDTKLLHPISHRTRSTHLLLSQLRGRRNLVESRTKMINAVRGMSKSLGARLNKCSTDSFHRHATAELPGEVVYALRHVIGAIGNVTALIRQAEHDLEIAAHEYVVVSRFRQVSGVGLLTALCYMLTIEDPYRFSRSRDVGSYLGLTRRRQQSGEYDPELGISKAGSTDMRALLVQAAHYILGPFGPDTALRRWGLEIAGRRGKRTALTAVARKLAVLLHRMWITGADYEPLRGCAAAA